MCSWGMFFLLLVSLAASAQIGRTSVIKPYLTLPYLTIRFGTNLFILREAEGVETVEVPLGKREEKSNWAKTI